MMTSKSFKFTRVDDQPVGTSDKAERLVDELKQLKKNRKRSNARGKDTQPSPAHSGAIHIIYDSEGRRKTKYPRKERRSSMSQGVLHVQLTQ